MIGVRYSYGTSFYRRLILAVFLGFAFSTILIAGKYWIDNFSQQTGLALSDEMPVGGDFLAFYNAGRLLAKDPARLYDFSVQWDEQRELFKSYPKIAESPLPFIYPPLVAVPFSYLSKLEFVQAYKILAVVGILIYTISIWLLSSTLTKSLRERMLILIVGLGFSPFLTLSILSGHLSFIGVFTLSIFFRLRKTGFRFLSGLVLSLSYYKPPLFLVFILFLVLQRDFRLLSGFVLGGAVLTALSIGVLGLDGMVTYLEQLPKYRFGSEVNPGIVFIPKQSSGLLGAISVLLPGQYAFARGIFFAVGALIIWFSAPALKMGLKGPESDIYNLQFALQVSLSLLLSLQMVDYDLAYLIVPVILVGNYLFKSVSNINLVYYSLVLLMVYSGWSFIYLLPQSYESACSAALLCIFSILIFALLNRSRYELEACSNDVMPIPL